jgi:hypothetical protein
LHSANVTVDPPHFGFQSLKSAEFDPDTLAEHGPFDELDFASLRRQVEGPHPETV